MQDKNNYPFIEQLQQQERIVSQLVEIVAKTNSKLKSLKRKVEELENNNG